MVEGRLNRKGKQLSMTDDCHCGVDIEPELRFLEPTVAPGLDRHLI